MRTCTISTHFGSKVCKAHNRRTPSAIKNQLHIKTGEGCFHKAILDRDTREVYHQLFDESLKEYNAKQTRKDREIKNYYKHIKNSGSKSVEYEMIIGVHKIDDPELQLKIIKGFASTWHKRNPNMYLTGIYLHNDEDSNDPHIHIDFVPFGSTKSCRKTKTGKTVETGMSKENSLTQALKEMGFEETIKNKKMPDGKEITKKKTPTEAWIRENNDYLEKLCIENGLTVLHPDREKAEKGIFVKHMPTYEYKRKMAEKEKQQEIKISENEKTINNINNDIDIQIDKYNKINNGIDIQIDNYNKNKDLLINQQKRLNNINLAISKQHEVFKENNAFLKNQNTKLANPTDQEIFNFIKETQPKFFNEVKKCLFNETKSDLDNSLPAVNSSTNSPKKEKQEVPKDEIERMNELIREYQFKYKCDLEEATKWAREQLEKEKQQAQRENDDGPEL